MDAEKEKTVNAVIVNDYSRLYLNDRVQVERTKRKMVADNERDPIGSVGLIAGG